ncbi:MAG: hypothetical protein JJU31_15080 [Wenzhouxiangella sp.]|nr:hypothetical protein [Wenzhouxiangella sp.]
MRILHLGFVVVVLGLLPGSVAQASYGIYIGKNLTADGSVFIGGSGDEPSSHWLVVQPRQQHDPGATITVGVTATSRATKPPASRTRARRRKRQPGTLSASSSA